SCARWTMKQNVSVDFGTFNGLVLRQVFKSINSDLKFLANLTLGNYFLNSIRLFSEGIRSFKPGFRNWTKIIKFGRKISITIFFKFNSGSGENIFYLV